MALSSAGEDRIEVVRGDGTARRVLLSDREDPLLSGATGQSGTDSLSLVD